MQILESMKVFQFYDSIENTFLYFHTLKIIQKYKKKSCEEQRVREKKTIDKMSLKLVKLIYV